MLYLGSGLLHFSVPLVFVCALTLTVASNAKPPANNTRVFISASFVQSSCFATRLDIGNSAGLTPSAQIMRPQHTKVKPHFSLAATILVTSTLHSVYAASDNAPSPDPSN